MHIRAVAILNQKINLATSISSVTVSYQPSKLVTRVRLPANAKLLLSGCVAFVISGSETIKKIANPIDHSQFRISFCNMVIPTPNVAVYASLSALYGMISIGSVILLVRIVYLDVQRNKKFSNFISKRFGRRFEKRHTDEDTKFIAESSGENVQVDPPKTLEQHGLRISPFSDKRLMFGLVVALSLVRFTQLAIQAGVSQFSEYRELLIIVSSFPGYVFISLMLMLVFFWTEMNLLSFGNSKVVSDQDVTSNNEATSLLYQGEQRRGLRNYFKSISASRFLKGLFILVNTIMYIAMVINDSLLLFQFFDPQGNPNPDNNDYTNPSPYTPIEIISVSVPTILFMVCALLVIVLGIIILRRHIKTYATFSVRNLHVIQTMLYVLLVTLTDVVVLIGRSGVLIAQIFYSWLETRWETILCYYLFGEIIPLLILNFTLYRMGSMNNTASKIAHSIAEKTTSSSEKKYSGVSRATEYYSNWDDPVEKSILEDSIYRYSERDYEEEPYDGEENETERDMDGETFTDSSSSKPTHHSKNSYGSSDGFKTRSRNNSGTVTRNNSPSHSLLKKDVSSLARQSVIKNAYDDFMGLNDSSSGESSRIVSPMYNNWKHR